MTSPQDADSTAQEPELGLGFTETLDRTNRGKCCFSHAKRLSSFHQPIISRLAAKARCGRIFILACLSCTGYEQKRADRATRGSVGIHHDRLSIEAIRFGSHCQLSVQHWVDRPSQSKASTPFHFSRDGL
jgi:hypothetical protein